MKVNGCEWRVHNLIHDGKPTELHRYDRIAIRDALKTGKRMRARGTIALIQKDTPWVIYTCRAMSYETD